MQVISDKIQYFLKSDINELFITNAIRSFGLSTIAVFIPIFFLQRGYSLNEVMFYFLMQATIGMFISYAAIKFCAKKGVKHSIMLSIPILIFFFFSLYKIDFIINLIGRIEALVFLTTISITSTAFFFMGFHVDFAKYSHRESSAKEISVIQALGIIFSILGPLFGAIIISFFSFNILFIIIIIVLALSIVPLFFSGELHEPLNFEWQALFKKEEIKHFWIYYVEGLRDYPARIFWPILLYLIAININEIGGIYTISNAILAIFTIYIGRKVTVGNKKKILQIGTIIHSLSLGVRAFLKTLSIIAIVQGFGGLSFSMIQVPFQSIFYNNSKKKGIPFTVFAREIYLFLGRFTITVVVAVLVLLLQPEIALIIGLLIGALVTLLLTRIEEL